MEVSYAPPEGHDAIAEKLAAWERFINTPDDLDPVTADGAWIDWILYMLEAVRESAESTTRTIQAIRQCQHDIAERARAATPGGRDARFLDLLLNSHTAVSRQTASSLLHALVVAGLLRELKRGRETPLANNELLHVLTRAE